jgi:hypothetical protein
MTYGPFHTLRCKDDIAAALLDGSDGEQSLTAVTPSATALSDRTDSRDSEHDAPSFLSNEETDATALTGPAAYDEQ